MLSQLKPWVCLWKYKHFSLKCSYLEISEFKQPYLPNPVRYCIQIFRICYTYQLLPSDTRLQAEIAKISRFAFSGVGLLAQWLQRRRCLISCPKGQQSLTWDPACQQSRACNSKVNTAMWTSFQPTEYFIPVLFICKFHKDWIKINTGYTPDKVECVSFHSRVLSNSKVRGVGLGQYSDMAGFQIHSKFYAFPDYLQVS